MEANIRGGDGLFEPHILLPSQWISTAQARTPEQRLLLAVLENAFDDLRMRPAVVTPMIRARIARQQTEAVAWFLSDATDWPVDFQCICDHLHLNADAIRSALRRHGFGLNVPSVKTRERGNGPWPNITGVRTARVLQRKRRTKWHAVVG